MTTHCRLCGELKEISELTCSIGDDSSEIKVKLIACCQWHLYDSNVHLPQSICSLCVEKLEKCWLFNETVAQAQTKLLEIFGEFSPIKCEVNIDEDNLTENIFVEPIPIPATISDCYDKPFNEQDTVESVDNESISASRKGNECNMCQKVFTTAYNLNVHKRIHTNERPYPCTECDKQFKSSSNLNQHMRQVHVRQKQNDDSNETATSASAKNEEIESRDTSDFKYSCNYCGRRFRLKCTLTAHRTVHSTERPYACYMCHRSFKRMKLLRAHMRIHTQYPQIECGICSKRFRRNIERDNHIKERHGVPAPKKVKKPPAPPKPKIQIRRYTCELCGMSFPQKGGLQSHMTVHSENRPHKCDLCGLGFKRKRTMQDHRKTHTDENEYKCTHAECNKTFRKKISLRRHLEYHTGQIAKPYICDFCGKGFRLNPNLVEHRRIHTGEKPYFCEHCGSNFRTMSSFYSHLKREHGISVLARKIEEQARATAMTTV